ncbi:MAG TPA: right-handed parallel beta-helix repeat-containing protein [Kofleriaceae bacterium]|nr:right-handed parallel beta-helix repeat-containing protein [Kofleriaceae bacterium]
MSSHIWIYISISLLAAPLGGCDYKNDPNHCSDNPHMNCMEGPIACEADRDCPTTAQVCDVASSKICVQCTAEKHDACSGTTPICAENACRGCAAHLDCQDSSACLSDGRCASPGEVAYVKAGGTGGPPCTEAMPCGSLQEGIDTGLPYVKIAAGTLDGVTTIAGRVVTILADPGARLTRSSHGVILEVRDDNTDVKISDLEISGATGTGAVGIAVGALGGVPKLTLTHVLVGNNSGGGISLGGGSLVVSQSVIAANQGGGIRTAGGALVVSRSTIGGNQGGGISISGLNPTFDITNSYIIQNGDQTQGTFGGVSLDFVQPGQNRLEFNTIVDNRSAQGSAGVICHVGTFAAPNNIVARNMLGASTTTPEAQISVGGCTYPSSRVQNDLAGLMLEHPDPPGMPSYKVMRGSTAIDQATTPSDIVVDLDGDPRPSGNGKDIGADELPQ